MKIGCLKFYWVNPQLSVEQLEILAEELLDLSSLEGLERWWEQN